MTAANMEESQAKGARRVEVAAMVGSTVAVDSRVENWVQEAEQLGWEVGVARPALPCTLGKLAMARWSASAVRACLISRVGGEVTPVDDARLRRLRTSR